MKILKKFNDFNMNESLSEAKYKVGDYVTYEVGDMPVTKAYGKIVRVVDLKKEYAYRIDSYHNSEDGIIFSSEKYNEIYEVQLRKGNKEKFLKFKAEYK